MELLARFHNSFPEMKKHEPSSQHLATTQCQRVRHPGTLSGERKAGVQKGSGTESQPPRSKALDNNF